MKCTPEQYNSIERDSRFHDLGTLPSNGLPYKDMKKFYIRAFELPELMLLSKSAQLKELAPLIRAVDNCISHDVYDLTIGDFYYVLLWLRMYSMPDSPYIIPWYCDAPFFTNKETRAPLFYTEQDWPSEEDLKEKYEVKVCDTHNTTTVREENTEIISLPEGTTIPDGFDYPRVAILEALTQAVDDPEYSFLAPAIQWIEGSTWEDKLARAKKDANLISIGLQLNKRIVHGIAEDVVIQCAKCRIKHTKRISLKAATFFQ